MSESHSEYPVPIDRPAAGWQEDNTPLGVDLRVEPYLVDGLEHPLTYAEAYQALSTANTALEAGDQSMRPVVEEAKRRLYRIAQAEDEEYEE